MDKNLPLELEYDFSNTFSLSAQQNAYPLFRSIRLHYKVSDSDIPETLNPLRKLVVKLSIESKIFSDEEWHIDEINPDQFISLQQRQLNIPNDVFFKLTEEMTLAMTLSIYFADNPDIIHLEENISITVLPAYHWGGESRQPDLLAAFVKPNGIYVESLVREVTEILEKNGYGRSADGYKSDRKKPYAMAAALWAVIFKQKIAYVIPPPSFASQGQRIRLAADISTNKLGACLDTSLLFASCLELMGLNPIIALSKEHAFVGVWLIDECFPVLTNDDPMDLRKRTAASDIVLFESTLVTNPAPVTFGQAREHASDLISEEKEDDFVYVIDIRQARKRKIKPLLTIEEKADEQCAEIDHPLDLPPIPHLPPVQEDKKNVLETPETRIDNWKRKLLDLTKRNSLLSPKTRTLSIKIYCPDIGLMEDKLAKGNTFKFLSVEQSPSYDNERSEETFRLQVGSNLHKEYALEQLKNDVLLTEMPKEERKSTLIKLFRKAKNDLEEGGANTLYLALGMLRWKENSKNDRFYRAPLILIPVELTRKSAQADIKMNQLLDETPIFNTTLIEFLYTEYDINLNQFRETLPEYESGVNVHLILDTVRKSVAEQPGFEVVEELVVASFSFARYLMWKDLTDRIDDLKQNLFVKHLIDTPRDSYVQNDSFISQDKVDEKISPEKIFTPLNCDSSQLVAVEASGKPQDFVLKGPPGTGKSETIANIICHNLAIGKKVLFVSEKMAALRVVYRRMEKVALDHLCLELHSNKANKKSVLEQFSAAEKRSKSNNEEWIDSVQILKDRRDHLNSFVKSLHKKSNYGISARDAIARKVRYENEHTLKLDWSLGFEAAPIQTAEQLNEMLESVDKAAQAYKDTSGLNASHFRILNTREWSNAWQSSVVDCLSRYQSAINNLISTSDELTSNFDIESIEKNRTNISRINSLAELIDSAESNPLSYLTSGHARDLLKDLKELGEIKEKFDQLLHTIGHNVIPELSASESILERSVIYKKEIDNLKELSETKKKFDENLITTGHSVSPEILENTPIAEWLDIYSKAKNSWFKSFFVKIKINHLAKKLGYEKFNDWEILPKIDNAIKLQKNITTLAPDFEANKVWQGWNTSLESLNSEILRREEILPNIENAAKLQDEITRLASPFKKDKIWLGWETTPNSLNEAFIRGEAAYKALSNAVGLTNSPKIMLTAVKSHLVEGHDFLEPSSKIIIQKNEFKKNWEEYIAIADEAKKMQLDFTDDDSFDQISLAIGELIKQSSKFKAWIEWLKAKEEVEAYQLNVLTSALEAQNILAKDAKEQVKTAFFRWVAPQLIDACDHLRLFKVSTHEKLLSEFKEIDAKVTKTTSAYIADILAKKAPNLSSRDAPKEFGVLSKELRRESRKPIRTLIKQMGESLLDLCPCMMMSPLSVAQFLPPNFKAFDLVVFDEASQITPWEAVGAIARGKNVIVVGDPKQMPPTNFFNKAVDQDEEDLESILDQALDAQLPALQLKGHYRSHHETLIAFSNSKYYNNSLITYPSSTTKNSAVTLRRINGVYARGKGSKGGNNPIEAKSVVDEIVKRLTHPEHCKKSIGVVTLNTEQQRTIEDLLDDARRKKPEIENYFTSTDTYDEVFVKNLESVQGDERDIIILSLGYGPTELGAQTMSMHFGPLNKSGGERRFNVAITRATTEVLVFSSFDSSMIDLNRTQSLAVEHLKNYLDFAEKGPSVLAAQSTADYGVDQFDSDFEEAVALALRGQGWKIQTQIGVSNYRIDLGVIHPNYPDVYLAGIECDGATYHSSPSARDRDRIRQSILENRGWKIIRVWSTDFFVDPEEAISRVVRQLNDILDKDSQKRSEEKNQQEQSKNNNIQIDDNDDIVNTQSVTDFELSEEPPDSDTNQYDSSRYFDNDYKPILIQIAKEILEKKNCITLRELILDIANRHGLKSTSKKQSKHIVKIIKPWAGIKHHRDQKVVWSSPQDISEEISWRGLNAFGPPRDWSKIPYPEARGLARLAIQKSPQDPVSYIISVFKLKRRHPSTLEEFQSWVDYVENDIS